MSTLREVDVVDERLGSVGGVATDGDRGLALALVAAREQCLIAGEDTGDTSGGQVPGVDAVDGDLDVGEHGRRDHLPQAGDLGVDALVGGDVVAGAGELGGQRVEQDGVHVVAHAEGEELRPLGRVPLDHLEDALGGLDTHRGQAVGQEHDGGRALTIEELHAALECATDVGVATRIEVAHVVDTSASVGGWPELVGEGAHVA